MFENVALSLEEKQIILGGLLGDAYFNQKREIIRFSHSVKQEEYLKWKYSFFNIDNLSKIYIRNYKKGYVNKYFELNKIQKRDSELLTYLKKYLYNKNGRKKISLKYLKNITALGLAVWWMDDGCLSIYKGNRYGKLCTECFNYEEHILLQQYFKNVWGIYVDVKIEKNKYYFLRFNVTALKKLISIIYKYVVSCPSMIYKIDLKYTPNYDIGEFQKIYDYIKDHIPNNI